MKWIVGATLPAVVLFLYATAAGNDTLRLITKPWPVLLLAVWVHLGSREAYAVRVRNGLLASVLGDICLELEGGFLPGMGAFLVAHLFYVRAFWDEDRRPRLLRALPFVLWGVALLYWLRDGLVAAGMWVPVAVYTAVICAMLWRAVARLDAGVGREVQLAAGGAFLFGISDSLIAASRFGTYFAAAPYAIILLYWLGQWGIAASVRRQTG